MTKEKKEKKNGKDPYDRVPGVDYSCNGPAGGMFAFHNPEAWRRSCERDPNRNPVLKKARSARVKRIRRLLWEAVRREDGYRIFLKLIAGKKEAFLDDFFRIWCPEEWERLRGLNSTEIAREQQEAEIAALLERLKGEGGPEVLRKVLTQVHHNRFEDALRAGSSPEDDGTQCGRETEGGDEKARRVRSD